MNETEAHLLATPEVHDWWSDPATREQMLRELRQLTIEQRDPYRTVEGYAIMLWLNLPGNQALAPHMDALLRAGLSPRHLLAAIPKKRGRPRAEPPAAKKPNARSRNFGMASLDHLVRDLCANKNVQSERDALRKICHAADRVCGKHARADSEVLSLQQKLSRWRRAQRVAQQGDKSD